MKNNPSKHLGKLIQPGVTCIVCSYNGSERIAQVLNALANQRHADRIAWEVIVVNNASTDDLETVAWNQGSRFTKSNLRVVCEPEPGLIHARLRGIREARYEYVSFIDDDNLVEEAWVYKVKCILDKHADVAVCGGQAIPVFEKEAPDWFPKFAGCYAVGKQYEKTGDVTEIGSRLWGAGMTIRKSALEALLEDGYQFKATGRKGKQLISGEDTELCYELRLAGWRLWYEEDLKLSHMIAASRLKWSYLIGLYKGFGSSKVLFAPYLERLALSDEPIRRQWFSELVRNTKLLIRKPIAIYYFITQREEKFSALKCAAILGRIRMLLTLRSRYDRAFLADFSSPQGTSIRDRGARQPNAEEEQDE